MPSVSEITLQCHHSQEKATNPWQKRNGLGLNAEPEKAGPLPQKGTSGAAKQV